MHKIHIDATVGGEKYHDEMRADSWSWRVEDGTLYLIYRDGYRESKRQAFAPSTQWHIYWSDI